MWTQDSGDKKRDPKQRPDSQRRDPQQAVMRFRPFHGPQIMARLPPGQMCQKSLFVPMTSSTSWRSRSVLAYPSCFPGLSESLMSAAAAVIELTPSNRTPEPVRERERIVAIDVLRGFAILCILPMNIQAFSMILDAYFNPMAYGDLHGANYWVWMLSHVLVDEKFMTIFAMLFGVGILLTTSRVEASGRGSAGLHYRRMGSLLLFGLLHAYLLWCGDILVMYAVCGLFVFPFRKRRPRTLLILAVLSLSVIPFFLVRGGRWAAHAPAAQLQKLNDNWKPPAPEVAREVAAYRGSWWTQMTYRVPQAHQMEAPGYLFRLFGLMLTGMALFKFGFFSGRVSSKLHLMLIGLALLVGIPITLYGVHLDFAHKWDAGYSVFYGRLYNYGASLLISFGWIGMVMLASRAAALTGLTRRLAVVGRMAFTNYIMQSVICTTIFYGHGFGLFGKVPRTGQFGIVVAIWIFQLSISPMWLRYFQFGPLEWLWRCLTYWHLEPIRRNPQLA